MVLVSRGTGVYWESTRKDNSINLFRTARQLSAMLPFKVCHRLGPSFTFLFFAIVLRTRSTTLHVNSNNLATNEILQDIASTSPRKVTF